MPFVQFNVKDEIERQCKTSATFKKIHEENLSEYNLIGEMTKARKKAGLTQGQLADSVGMKQQTISRIEKRENSPSLHTVCRVLDLLGLELKIVSKQTLH